MRYRGYFSLSFKDGVGQGSVRKNYSAEFNVDAFETAGQWLRKYIGGIVDRYDVDGVSIDDIEKIGPDDQRCPLVVYDLSGEGKDNSVVSSAVKNLSQAW